MSMVCELTGKRVLSGNKVSHSQRKTKRKYLPNLQSTTFLSGLLGFKLRFKISTNAIKTVDKHGGIDEYLIGADKDTLSARARKVRVVILSKAKLQKVA